MIATAWERAHLLAQQGRWDLAEAELRRLLQAAPEFQPAHALLAIALTQRGALDEAMQAARTAVTLDPEDDFALRALAGVQLEHEELTAAAETTGRAIAIAPESPAHRALLAQIRFRQDRWQDCIDAADQGLRLDPQDTDCLNLRSLALTKLGRSAEADASVEASLAHDPDNPFTHQARGFALLQQGKAMPAAQHFREALRRDPTLDGARAGLVEAIKSKNPLYRLVLAPFVWLERFPPARRTQLLIAVWFAAQLASRSLRSAGYEGAATVVSFSWLGAVLLTFCIVPLFNLLLLLHPVGRHALDRFARGHALLLGGVLLVTVGMFVGDALVDTAWLPRSRWFWLIYLLPVAGLGTFHGGWARTVQKTICVGLLLAWSYWAWHFGAAVDDMTAALERATQPSDIAAADVVERLRQSADPAARQFDRLLALSRTTLWAAALSTWFVMLAPKGRRRRRRTTS